MTHSRTRTARPDKGLTTYAAQEARWDSVRQGLDDIVEDFWGDYDVWKISSIASKLLSVTITPKEVYSSHLRTRRERERLDTNQVEGQKEGVALD